MDRATFIEMFKKGPEAVFEIIQRQFNILRFDPSRFQLEPHITHILSQP